MPFTPVFKQIPKNVIEWAQYFRAIRNAPGSIDDDALRDSVGLSVIGRASSTTGSPADITAGSNDTFLRRVGDILSFGVLTIGMIPNALITYAKLQNVSATDKLLGRSSSGAGSVEEIDCTAAGRALLDDANAAAQRTTLGLGTAATQNTGTSGANVPLLSTANTWSAAQTFSAPPIVPSYTVAGVPSASPAAQVAYISNESGGAVLAFSDGTNWRRVTDRAVIS